MYLTTGQPNYNPPCKPISTQERQLQLPLPVWMSGVSDTQTAGGKQTQTLCHTPLPNAPYTSG